MPGVLESPPSLAAPLAQPPGLQQHQHDPQHHQVQDRCDRLASLGLYGCLRYIIFVLEAISIFTQGRWAVIIDN